MNTALETSDSKVRKKCVSHFYKQWQGLSSKIKALSKMIEVMETIEREYKKLAEFKISQYKAKSIHDSIEMLLNNRKLNDKEPLESIELEEYLLSIQNNYSEINSIREEYKKLNKKVKAVLFSGIQKIDFKKIESLSEIQ